MISTNNPMDKAIAWAFPGWGFRRAQARTAMQIMASISPLTPNRQTGQVPGNPSSLDDKIPFHDRLKMIDIFDTELCESPLLSAMIDQFVRNVVPPTGLRPIPDTGNNTFDGELTRHFDDWAETCEVRGHSFWQLEQVLLKSVMGHGDAGMFNGVQDGTMLQGIPAAKVATPMEHMLSEGTLVHQGIYTGTGTTPQGYYVMPRDKWGAYRQEDTRYLPANRCWWFSRPTDFESYRGSSAFLSGYQQMRMAKSLLNYKSMQVKMASVFGIAITKNANKSTSPVTRLGSGNSPAETTGKQQTTEVRPDIELFNGMGITLDEGEGIEIVESKIAAGDFNEFFRLICRYFGISCGLPLEFVLLDWSKANYYGNRMAAACAMRAFYDWWTVPARLAKLAYAERAAAWLADGTVKAPSVYDRDPRLCTVTLPPAVDVDPEKSLTVWRKKIEANLASEEDFARAQGDTLDRIIESRKRSLKKQKDAKLPIVVSVTPGVKLLSELEAVA